MGRRVDIGIDCESKHDRRFKRVFDRCLCAVCGKLLNKKEERNGTCWECFSEELSDGKQG
jgi:predicted amidophosphoribosyltransferase